MKRLLTLCSFTFLAVWAQARETLTPANLFDLVSVVEVALAPDGQHVAYSVHVPRPFADGAGEDYRELHVYDRVAGRTLPFIRGPRQVFSLGWTPDGKAITFRAVQPGAQGMQVHAIDLQGGEAYPLTRHPGGVRTYAFIDQQTLALVALAPEDSRRQELRRKGFRVDVYEEEFRHLNLYRYDLRTHQARQLTRDVTVFDFALAPGGKLAVAAIAPRNLVDDSYMSKRIHSVDLQTGETKLLVDNPGKLGTLAWSPDGSKLAFRASSKIEDSVVGSLFVAELGRENRFEELRNLVEGLELSVIDVAWKDDQTLLFAAEEGVDIVLSEQRLDRPGRTKLIEPGNVVFRNFKRTGQTIALAGNTWRHPSELFLFDLEKAELSRRTFNNGWLDQAKFGQQRKLVYQARDGKSIQGVLVYPLDYKQDDQYPLIVYIHGGPEAAVKNGWCSSYSMWGQVAAARGYFVFKPNYRASSGRGVAFTMAGYGDLVGVEYDDVLDGIDHLIDSGYVDRERVGIGGGSYGGYFAAWSATRHTERFAASVVFVGIANQISKRNTTDIPLEDYLVHWGYWTHENWPDVYGRSPVKYAHQSQTPTLILHGTEDTRVPPSQGLELYRALKLHGHAPTRLIYYQGEGHGNRLNLHRLDYLVRTLEWFDYYLKSDFPKEEMPPLYPDYKAFER